MGMAHFDEVIAGARNGEGWAFDALFREWNPPITGFVRARGVASVDDVVNEIFLGAFTSIGRFRGTETDFRSWLYRIARNKVADSFRRSFRQPATRSLSSTDDTVGVGDVESDAHSNLGLERVMRLLDTLTDEQREVLLLRIVGDLTIDQIAEITGRRRGAVKQLQRRGLRRLEALLGDSSKESNIHPYPLEDDER